jgi:pyruvate dehydrogenase E1 component alpha subunit
VRQGRQQAVLCELGDGAVNMGAWHESLNLAALWELPIVFLVVNNLYGMGTSVDRASAEPEIWRRASAFRMHGERVDGDDLDASLESAGRLLAAARRERRPAVLEAMTYRYRGHSVADAGLSYRSKEEIEEHRRHDPIDRAADALADRGALRREQLDELREHAEQQVREAVEFADESPEPDVESLAEHLYGDPASAEQHARMRAGAPFAEADVLASEASRA